MNRKRMKRWLVGILFGIMITSATLAVYAASYSGDLNGDGSITAFDAQMLAEANAGRRQLNDEQKERAANLSVRGILNKILGIAEPEPEDPQAPTEEDTGVCETAEEFAANMKMGWNLGCSLSVSSKITPAS